MACRGGYRAWGGAPGTTSTIPSSPSVNVMVAAQGVQSQKYSGSTVEIWRVPSGSIRKSAPSPRERNRAEHALSRHCRWRGVPCQTTSHRRPRFSRPLTSTIQRCHAIAASANKIHRPSPIASEASPMATTRDIAVRRVRADMHKYGRASLRSSGISPLMPAAWNGLSLSCCRSLRLLLLPPHKRKSPAQGPI